MFDGIQREWFVRRTLRRMARQRVVTVLQPGNVWVIEGAPAVADRRVVAAQRTCHMRGWVEGLSSAVPQGELGPRGELPTTGLANVAPVYRLTEAGWNAVHRIHGWVVFTALATAVVLALTIVLVAKGG